MDAIVSVVVPAYNAEKTLTRCVESLLRQTLREIRVIIVDDGSKDATPEIADELAVKDDRVEVVHKANGGCYLARHSGLERVRTKYFGFADADDWVEPDMYASLLDFAEKHKLDVAECGVYGQAQPSREILYLDRRILFEKLIYPRMMVGRGSNTVWNKLYRNQYDFSAFIKSFFSTWEDLVNNLQFFLPVQRYGCLNKGLYHYVVTGASSTRNFGRKNILGLKETIRVRSLLALQYGLTEDDPALSRWIVHNVRNMYLSAVSAPAASWVERMDNVRTLLAMPELQTALSDSRLREDNDRSFVSFVRRGAIGMKVAFFNFIKRIKH